MWLLPHWSSPVVGKLSSSSSFPWQTNCRITNFSKGFQLKILYINNDGGGFADHIDVPDGTTVRELFQRQVQSGKAEHYLIRVNRQPVPPEQVLQPGDRVSLTPVKIEGAS